MKIYPRNAVETIVEALTRSILCADNTDGTHSTYNAYKEGVCVQKPRLTKAKIAPFINAVSTLYKCSKKPLHSGEALFISHRVTLRTSPQSLRKRESPARAFEGQPQSPRGRRAESGF